jgi:tetratricopeptide (TPR) repeat protein
MFLAPSSRRAFAGLFLAMPLIAIGPPVSAQNGNVHNLPNGYITANSPAGYRDAHAAPPKRASLFGDQGLNLKLPFTRTKSPAQPPNARQQTMTGRSIPHPQAATPQPRIATGQTNRKNVPARMPTAQRLVHTNKYQPLPVAQAAVQAGAAQRGAAPQRTLPRQNSPMPRPMPMAAQASAVPLTQKVAVQNASAATPKSPPDSPAMQVLAQAHEWSTKAQTESDYTRVIEACRQAGAEPSSPEIERYVSELSSWALNRRGQLRAEAGRHNEALSDFDAALQADAKRWRAVHNRGVLLAGNGEFEKAFEDFTRTIELNPTFAKAYSNRAALFVVSGNVQSATHDYTKAVELDPELTVAHRGLGRACHIDGQLDAAVRHYDEAVRLAPNDAYAIASRADVLSDLGHYAEAAADYERAIQADPNLSHAHSGSAWLLATCPDDSIRDPQLALERAQTAIDLTGGEDAASFDTLAAAQANNGDFAGATQSIEQAVRLANPGEKQAYQDRLSLYQQNIPFRLEPAGSVLQTSHDSDSE